MIGRAVKAARLQLVNPLQVAMPWLVLTLAFTFNLVLFASIADADPEVRITGGLSSIYVVMLVGHLISMTQVFPFALGLSITRREFFTGTSLLILAQSVVQGLVITVVAGLENATGGWGLNLMFFRVPLVAEQSFLVQLLIYTVPFVALSYASVFIGTVFKRWNQLGMYVLGLGGAVVLGTAAVLLTWLEGWPAVGRFFVETPIFALTAGYPALVAVLLAGLGLLVLRRAVP